MGDHERVTTVCSGGGDVSVWCTCGWVSPRLHGETMADIALFLHRLDHDELVADVAS